MLQQQPQQQHRRNNRKAAIVAMLPVMLPIMLIVWCTLPTASLCDRADIESVDRRRSIGSGIVGSEEAVDGASSWEPLGNLRSRRNAEHNLCDKQGCRCSGASAVQCNLTEHSVSLNAHFYLSASITVVELNLSSHTALQIQAGFLHNNRVQRLAIHGGQQFELATDALASNTAAKFQQIDVFGTAHVVLSARSLRGELKLNVRDAQRVIVFREAFAEARFVAEFRRVRDLSLHESALERAHHKSHLVVVDSAMDDLWPLAASLSEFRMEGVRVARIRERAFDVNQLDAIEFRGCDIGEVDREAFTAKLFCKSLQFIDCRIGTFATDALHESGISQLLLASNRISHIQTAALSRCVTTNTSVVNNTIGQAAPLWLTQADWQTVHIANNRFGSYARPHISSDARNPLNCTFSDNLITQIASGEPGEALWFEYSSCRVHNITFAQRCDCTDSWPRRLFRGASLDSQLRQVNCAVDSVQAGCFNTTHMVWPEFHAEVCIRSRRYAECSELAAERTRMQIHGFARPMAGDGEDKGGVFGTAVGLGQIAAVAGGVGVLVVLLIALGMVCNRMKVEQRRRQAASSGAGSDEDGGGGMGGNVTCSEQILTRCDATALAAREANAFRTCDRNATQMPLMLVLAMKPSKSFSADDRAIIRQTLHEMRGRYDGPLYDRVYQNTVKVLNGGLAEADKVRAIGEIVEALRECQLRWGGDFVAFTDILYRQLVPVEAEAGGQEDPVYAELNETAEAAAALGAENIYAEPHQHLQQLPLLAMCAVGEYAWPLDRDQAPAYEEYAEPLRASETQTRQIISPYAIANTAHPPPPSHHPTLPSALTLRQPPRLPDLLPSTSSAANYRQYPPPPYTLRATPHPNQTPLPPSATAAATAATAAAMGKPPVYSLPKPKVRPQRTVPGGMSTSPAGPSASAVGADDEAQNMSDHSGGSDVTFRMDELLYADATAPRPSAI